MSLDTHMLFGLHGTDNTSGCLNAHRGYQALGSLHYNCCTKYPSLVLFVFSQVLIKLLTALAEVQYSQILC